MSKTNVDAFVRKCQDTGWRWTNGDTFFTFWDPAVTFLLFLFLLFYFLCFITFLQFPADFTWSAATSAEFTRFLKGLAWDDPSEN